MTVDGILNMFPAAVWPTEAEWPHLQLEATKAGVTGPTSRGSESVYVGNVFYARLMRPVSICGGRLELDPDARIASQLFGATNNINQETKTNHSPSFRRGLTTIFLDMS